MTNTNTRILISDFLFRPVLTHVSHCGNEYYCQLDSIETYYQQKDKYYVIYYLDDKEDLICDILERYLKDKLVFVDTEFLSTYQYIGKQSKLSKVQPMNGAMTRGVFRIPRVSTPKNNATVCFVLSICVSDDLPMVIWFSPDTQFTQDFEHCYIDREKIERRIGRISTLLSTRTIIGFATSMDSILLRVKMYDIQPIVQQLLFPTVTTLVSLKTIYKHLFDEELDKEMRSWNWSICSEVPESYAIKDAIAVKDIFDKLKLNLLELHKRHEQQISQKRLKFLRSVTIPFYYKLTTLYGDKAFYNPIGGKVITKFDQNLSTSLDRSLKSYNGKIINSWNQFYLKLKSNITEFSVIVKSFEKLEDSNRKALYQFECQCLNLLIEYDLNFKAIYNSLIFSNEFEHRRQIIQDEISLRFEFLYKPFKLPNDINMRIIALSNSKLNEYVFQLDTVLIHYYNNYQVQLHTTNNMNTICSLKNHNGEYFLEIGIDNQNNDQSKIIILNNKYKQSNNKKEQLCIIIEYCQFMICKIYHDSVLLNSDKSSLVDYLNILIVFLKCDYEESLFRQCLLTEESTDFYEIISKYH